MDVGEKLGKYEVRGTLGRGAMGVVYDGWDPLIERRVAIKTVPIVEGGEEESEGLARFRREAQAAGRMQHPNVVAVYDYGETPEFAYLVMEFVDGRSLKSALDANERFPVPEVVLLMRQLLEAVQFSHDHGVIHRDIKPANIILTRRGMVKVADFGVARIESSSMTQVGTVLGTPAYMSPEQLSGQPVDSRSDIYSAGVVLYQLLTGDRPYQGTNFSSIYHQALNSDPVPPSKLAVTVPLAFDAVVAKAMAKRPQERYASASEFSAAIEAAAAGANSPAPPAPVDADATMVASPRPAVEQRGPATAAPAALPPPKSGNRNALIAATAGVALLLAGGGAWYATRPTTPHGTTPNEARPAALVTPQPPARPAVAVTPATPKPAVAPPAKPAPAVSHPPPVGTTKSAPTAAAPPVPPVAPYAEAPRQPTTEAPKEAQKLALAPVALRKTLAADVASVDCTLVHGSVSDAARDVQVSGVAGRGLPTTELQRAVQDAAPTAAIDWHVASFDGPYCRAVDVLRPVAASFADTGFRLALRNGARALVDGEFITIDLTTPDYPAWLTVDYLQHDGTVVHLYPTAKNPAREFAPDSRTSLGDPARGGERWQVGAPYGGDMIIAIASSEPLFTQRRQEFEQTSDYLLALQDAIAAARAHDARMSASAVVLLTKPKL